MRQSLGLSVSDSLKVFFNLVQEALEVNASDIHFDPYDSEVQVKFRINGFIQSHKILDLNLYHEILLKIKLDCHFRIDDHVNPKAGSFNLVIDKKEIFLRISILPTFYGENLVIRILKKNKPYYLNDIGISTEDGKNILNSILKPGNIGVVMGPTGSGKTTTLYALVHELNKGKLLIVTIEDPIENWISGVRQIQINEDKDFGFAKILKSTLRQNPDVILIGEIRDLETALLAFQAALTGHVVITSIHAYEDYHLIPRLISLGVPEYLIKALKIISINQRLIPKLCPDCKEKIEIEQLDSKYYLGESKDMPLFHSKGCSKCNYSGVIDQILVYEINEGASNIRDKVTKLILKSSVSFEMVKNFFK